MPLKKKKTVADDLGILSLLYLNLLARIAKQEKGQVEEPLADICDDALRGAQEAALLARRCDHQPAPGSLGYQSLVPIIDAIGDCLLLLSTLSSLVDIQFLPLLSSEKLLELLQSEPVVALKRKK